MASQSTISGVEGSAGGQEDTHRRLTRAEKLWLSSILIFAGGFYAWSLDANGWANSYYAGAVQAGLHDAESFFFGSADWGNSITVDKPPLSLWVMGISTRLFGFNSWALLLPQAAMTVFSTLLIFKLARHVLASPAALLAAGIFATTPITVLLARYNNPDPLMILLMLGAFYLGVRASESGRPGLLYLASGLLALGFLTKQLQAFLVLPAIMLVFMLFAGRPWRSKTISVMLATLLLMGGSLAWPLIVDLTPSNSRPFVGGSMGNSMLELTLGYNGVNRVIQHEDDPSVALIPAAMRTVDSDAGFFRLWNVNYGQEIGWLLLPALIACIAVLIRLWQRKYSRAGSIVAAGAVVWFFSTYLMLSFMGNSFHSYYTASLAPPLALCLGLGFEILISGRPAALKRIGISGTVVGGAIFSRAMWQLSDSYPEWLGTGLFFLALIAASVLLIPAPRDWLIRAAGWIAAASLLVGPLYCSAITVATPKEGSNPLSGGISRNENSLSRFLSGIRVGNPAWAAGLASGNAPGPELSRLLRDAPDHCTWAAATYPGQTAARFQLDVNRPIMPLGGFAATDPSPTLEQFQAWVNSGRICYLVLQPDQLKVPGNSEEVIAINRWIGTRFVSEEVDGVTIYRLTR